MTRWTETPDPRLAPSHVPDCDDDYCHGCSYSSLRAEAITGLQVLGVVALFFAALWAYVEGVGWWFE